MRPQYGVHGHPPLPRPQLPRGGLILEMTIMQTDHVEVLRVENKTNSASSKLLTMLKVKQGKVTLAGRLCRDSKSCAGIQLTHYQQHAMLKKNRFESIVNDAWSTTLRGTK